ncbi:RDD family protein, partial [Tsukamurella soli]
MSEQATARPDATSEPDVEASGPELDPQTEHDTAVRATAAPLALRVLAYIADLCLVATVVAVALIVDVLADLELGWVFFGIGALVALVASIAMHGAWGASPGKQLAQLRVVDAETAGAPGYPRAAIRTVVFDVLSVIVYLPAWSVLIDKTRFRRGLHEKVSHTLVVDATEAVSSTAVDSAAPARSGFGAPARVGGPGTADPEGVTEALAVP